MTISKDFKNLVIQGSGGGKGGGATAPVEAPNTLQSRSTIKVVEVLSEGEVIGVVGGLQGVYFDDTPVGNLDGTFNFPAVLFDQRMGEDPQSYMPGFPGTENAFSVNTQVTQASPVTRQNSAVNVDAIRVTVRLPNGLSTLDTSTGDLNGYTLPLAIDVRIAAGTFQQVFTKIITGKSTTPYEESYRIEKPAGILATQRFSIRVRRLDLENPSSNIANRLDVFAVTEINDIQVGYENAAVVGVALDSESTGGNVPGRAYLLDGIQIQVPQNYLPTVYNADGSVSNYASYTGTWDGTFKTSWCDDPAWILYDLLTNERYGMGEYIDTSTIDIYSFYNAGVYNTQLIDDNTGSGHLEPRFRFNGVVQTREDAYKVLQAVAGSMRAMIFSGPGFLKLVQDAPQSVSALINNANVIDGQFSYTGTTLTDRTTSVNVTYNDATDRYLSKTVNSQATSGQIAAYGFNKIELATIGVCHEAQARRLANWALDSSLNTTDVASFKVSWSNAFIEIGDVVAIADSFYAAMQFSGEIMGGTATSLITDRPVVVSAGQQLKYRQYDGTEIVRTITNSGTVTTITFSSGDNPNNSIGSVWAVYGTVVPRQFKITNISEDTTGIYNIQATFYDPTKYARVEQGIFVDPPPYTAIGGYTVAAPTGLNNTTETYTDPYGVNHTRLRFDWTDVADPLLRGYKVRYRKDNGPYVWSDEVNQSEWRLDNAQPGVYQWNVYTYNNRGIQSPPSANASYTLAVQVGTSPISSPTGLVLTGGLTTTTFADTTFTLIWNAPTSLGGAILKDYQIRFYDGSANLKYAAYIDPTTRTFTASNVDVDQWYGTAVRSMVVNVVARDTLLRFSNPAVVTISNPAPPVLTGITSIPYFNYFGVNHTATTATDGLGVLINGGITTGFVPGPTNKLLDDVGTVHLVSANPGTTYFYRIAEYDSWSSDPSTLIYSAEQTVTTTSDVVGLIPTAPTGLAITFATITQPTGSQSARGTITWNGVANMTGYDLVITEGTGSCASFSATSLRTPTVGGTGTGTQTYTFDDGIPGRFYKVKVRSRANAAVSVYSTEICAGASADTIAPGVPGVATVIPGYRLNYLKWINATDDDLSGTEIHSSTVNGFTPSTSTLITTVSAPLNTFIHTNLIIATPGTTPPVAAVTYYYRTRSIDLSGNPSAYSTQVSGIPLNVGTDTITASEIAAHTITATEIFAGTITATEISARSITADRLQVGTITATEINAGSISAAILTADSITTTQLAVGAVFAENINTASLVTLLATINTAYIETANIVNATITSALFAGTIQSDNFVTGVSGWQIRRDTGAAEFGNLTARGDFTAGATGTGFRLFLGTSNATYIQWAGSGTMNDTNAVFYIKKNGSAYFGGALVSGVINTSARTQGAQLAGNAYQQTCILGPYTDISGTNTTVYPGYTYTYSTTANTTQIDCTGNGTVLTSNFKLERSIDGGATWTTLSTGLSGTMTMHARWESGVCTTTMNGGQGYTFADTFNSGGGHSRAYRLSFNTYNWLSGNGLIDQTLSLQVIQTP